MWSRFDFDITKLFEEGLEYINITSKTTFADFQAAGGQAVEAVVNFMRNKGIDDNTIRKNVYAFSENGLYLSLLKDKLSNLPVTIMEYNEDIKTKFDVVIGNPPYNWSDGENQRKNNRENLWTRFVFKGWDMLNKNGYLIMVTPKSWMSPSADFGKRKIYQEVFKNGNPIYVNIDECAKHFNVGSTFSFYVVQKNENKGNTKVKTNDGEFNFDFSSTDSLPTVINPMVMSIIQKFFSQSYMFNFQQKGITTRGEEFKTEPFGEYVNPTYHTNSKPLVYSRFISEEQENQKIMICLSGMYKPVFDYDGIISQTNMNCVYNLNEGENMGNYELLLNHKLYKLIMNNLFKYNGWVNMNLVQRLPKIDFDGVLDSDKIYELFQLTEEEKEYVEGYS